jgi:hypothetical protein
MILQKRIKLGNFHEPASKPRDAIARELGQSRGNLGGTWGMQSRGNLGIKLGNFHEPASKPRDAIARELGGPIYWQ